VSALEAVVPVGRVSRALTLEPTAPGALLTPGDALRLAGLPPVGGTIDHGGHTFTVDSATARENGAIEVEISTTLPPVPIRVRRR
jgi:hypothetical protein